jgi:hypothetical protein
MTRDDLLAAAGRSEDPGRWLGTFDELMTRAGARCWTIAEHAGDRTPDGMQHLLSRARWDADGVRQITQDHAT